MCWTLLWVDSATSGQTRLSVHFGRCRMTAQAQQSLERKDPLKPSRALDCAFACNRQTCNISNPDFLLSFITITLPHPSTSRRQSIEFHFNLLLQAYSISTHNLLSSSNRIFIHTKWSASHESPLLAHRSNSILDRRGSQTLPQP